MAPFRQCSNVSGPVAYFVIGKLRNTVVLSRLFVFLFQTLFHLSRSSLFPWNQRSVCVIAPWLRLIIGMSSGAADDVWIIRPPQKVKASGGSHSGENIH